MTEFKMYNHWCIYLQHSTFNQDGLVVYALGCTNRHAHVMHVLADILTPVFPYLWRCAVSQRTIQGIAIQRKTLCCKLGSDLHGHALSLTFCRPNT